MICCKEAEEEAAVEEWAPDAVADAAWAAAVQEPVVRLAADAAWAAAWRLAPAESVSALPVASEQPTCAVCRATSRNAQSAVR